MKPAQHGPAAQQLPATAHPPGLVIRRFDPAGHGFPRAALPVLPWLRRADLHWTAQPAPRPGRPGATVRPFAFGRYALHAALQAAGVGPGSRVLVPAYHCRTMVDGALALGAEVDFYRVGADLRMDVDDLNRRLEAPGLPVRALVAAHLFGFAQPMQPAADAAARHGAVLVEDCSHVATGAADPALGSTGRFGIASPYKFYPLQDGGLLWDNEGARLPRAAAGPGWVDEARGAWRTWGLSRQPAAPAPAPAGLPAAAAAAAAPLPPEADPLLADDHPSEQFDARRIGAPGLAGSRWLMRRIDVLRLSQRRRQRYAQWLQAAQGWSGVRPLHAELPAATVPYMFPLLLERPATQFPALKRAAVPVGRWDDMAVSDCPVATHYRGALIHLPCHQALDDAQFDWLLTTTRQALLAA